MGKLFGTDGIRGVANIELTAELAYKVGRVSAYVITEHKQGEKTPKIIVGADTRISGHMLESAIVAGICSMGVDAICAGVIPTPGIAYLVKKYNMDAGVVISASHNTFEYNGIKIFNELGFKLSDDIENEIEEILLDDEKYNNLPMPSGVNIGRKIENERAKIEYVDFIKTTTDDSLSGIKVALDCANGAAYTIAPFAISELGASVRVINNQPNGININKGCGSTHLDSIVKFVKETNADVGFAFDGDADRCLAVDELGNIIDGDKLLAIFANFMKEKNRLKNNKIVVTVMTNLGFFLMAEEKGIETELTNVGDRYVLEAMLEKGINIGGEQSGHIIFLEHNTTGDGILTAIQLLNIMKQTGKKLSELASIMESLPQVLVNAIVKNGNKYKLSECKPVQNEINRLIDNYKNKGRVLVRPSGTEPLVRVMIEGKDIEKINSEAKELALLIENHLG